MTNSTHFNMESIAWWRGKNLINLFRKRLKGRKSSWAQKMLDWRVNFHWKSFWWKSPTDRRQECNFSCFWQLMKVVTKNFPSTPKHGFCVLHFCAEKSNKNFPASQEKRITDEKSWELIGSRDPVTYGSGRLCKRQDSSGSIITFCGFAPSRPATCNDKTWTTVVNYSVEV